jgi:hypothetical protein
MGSRKQLEANRANAKQSTGPKSALGKARSSMNACKHGLTAKTIVIGDEDPGQFEILRAAFEDEFQPRSLMERELVEYLAALTWRRRRVPVFEAGLIEAIRAEIDPAQSDASAQLELRRRLNEKMAPFEAAYELEKQKHGVPAAAQPEVQKKAELQERTKEEDEPRKTIGLALMQDNRLLDALGKLFKHEAALRNEFTRTLQLLFSLQSSRRNAENSDSVAIGPPSASDAA